MSDKKESESTSNPNLKDKPKIIVHEIPRAKYTPSISPYPIKLETYLRMAGLPYEPDFKNAFSKKGKTPWMTIDGEDVADSYFCIDHLKKNYGVDLNEHLTAEQKAVAVAFRTLVEDHLFWAALTWRVNKENMSVMKTHMETNFMFRNIILPLFRRKSSQYAHAQGMGRHSWDEIKQFIMEDVNALATYLGDKKYLMGDKPSEVDCSVFGLMCQFMYNTVENVLGEWMESGPGEKLKEYVLRIKEEFWPDWDQCLNPPREVQEGD